MKKYIFLSIILIYNINTVFADLLPYEEPGIFEKNKIIIITGIIFLILIGVFIYIKKFKL